MLHFISFPNFLDERGQFPPPFRAQASGRLRSPAGPDLGSSRRCPSSAQVTLDPARGSFLPEGLLEGSSLGVPIYGDFSVPFPGTDPQLPRSDSSPVVGGSASGGVRFTQALSVLENDAGAAVVGSGFHTGGPDFQICGSRLPFLLLLRLLSRTQRRQVLQPNVRFFLLSVPPALPSSEAHSSGLGQPPRSERPAPFW